MTTPVPLPGEGIVHSARFIVKAKEFALDSSGGVRVLFLDTPAGDLWVDVLAEDEATLRRLLSAANARVHIEVVVEGTFPRTVPP